MIDSIYADNGERPLRAQKPPTKPYCTSHVCAGRPKKATDYNFKALKNFPKQTNFCKDCGHALIWE